MGKPLIEIFSMTAQYLIEYGSGQDFILGFYRINL